MKREPVTTNKKHQRLALALISAATIVGISACGTTGTGTGPSAPASSAAPVEPSMSASPTGPTTGSPETAVELTIHIESFAYTGPDSVPAGATVTVMNMDAQAHTVTSDDGSFDAVVKPGNSVTFTSPIKPGSYTYHCTYHSSMQGTLVVK